MSDPLTLGRLRWLTASDRAPAPSRHSLPGSGLTALQEPRYERTETEAGGVGTAAISPYRLFGELPVSFDTLNGC